MEYKLVNLEKFNVIGISVRTINHEGQSDIDIGNLWGKFMSNNLLAQIPNRLDDDIFCVYTDYENDYTGLYTAILGCKVKKNALVPDGFINVEIPGGNYYVYLPLGEFPASVANTWKYIWQSSINRKYTADFDRYKTGAKSFAETEAEIYLAVG